MSSVASRSLLIALAVTALAAYAQVGKTAPPKPAHRSSITEGLDCSACHTPSGWQSMGASSGSSGFDHSRTGFPLAQRHRAVPCVGCHNSEQEISRECSSCHQDPHLGQLGRSCDSCHSATSWFQTSATRMHRQTRLPLTGMHALVECRDCHQRLNEGQWNAPPADCIACHVDDYRRPDIHPPHLGVPGDLSRPAFPQDCTQCHRSTAWTPAYVRADLVARGFALTREFSHDSVFVLSRGPHRDAPCGSCHASDKAPQVVRCSGCHTHSEVVTRQQHANVAGFGQACLSCHPGGAVR